MTVNRGIHAIATSIATRFYCIDRIGRIDTQLRQTCRRVPRPVPNRALYQSQYHFISIELRSRPFLPGHIHTDRSQFHKLMKARPWRCLISRIRSRHTPIPMDLQQDRIVSIVPLCCTTGDPSLWRSTISYSANIMSVNSLTERCAPASRHIARLGCRCNLIQCRTF